MLAGKSDLAFTMSFEVLPQIAITDLTALKLEREVADVADEAVDKALADLAERATRYEVEADRAAGDGDRMTIDFVGSIDGVEFEGGKGEDVQLVVGQSQLHSGLRRGHHRRQGRRGARRQRQIPGRLSARSRWPARTPLFKVKVKEVAKPIKPEHQRRVRQDAGRRIAAPSCASWSAPGSPASTPTSARSKLKRQVLDALDKAHDFALPQSLVDGEFEGIWEQLSRT